MQDLKSLLENIRNILMEGPPGWTAEHPEGWDPTEWMYDTLKPYIPPKPEGWVGDWPPEGWEDIIPPLSRPEWDDRIPIRNPIYWDADDTPPTQEEIERYFTDSVEPNQNSLNMNKQNLKSLLENIYYLLVEDDLPPEEPRDTVTPTVPPGMSPQERTSFYDRINGPPPMPWWGPWSPNPNTGVGVWSDAFHHWEPFWPPPTSLVPDGHSAGGMWMRSSNPQCPQCGFQYWYVYPQPNGQFWMHEYFLQFPGQFRERKIFGTGWM